MPGFGPAAELVAWRIPKGGTFVVSAKEPKTIDTPSGHIGRDGRRIYKSGPTRYAQTRPAEREERPPLGPDGRRRTEIKVGLI